MTTPWVSVDCRSDREKTGREKNTVLDPWPSHLIQLTRNLAQWIHLIFDPRFESSPPPLLQSFVSEQTSPFYSLTPAQSPDCSCVCGSLSVSYGGGLTENCSVKCSNLISSYYIPSCNWTVTVLRIVILLRLEN